MLRVAVVFMLAVMVCDVIGDDFYCFPNQTIYLTNPDASIYTFYRAFYSNGGTDTNCTTSSTDNDITVTILCDSTVYNMTVYFSNRNMSHDGIIGGAGDKSLMYTFRCAVLISYNTTLYGNLASLSINHSVESSNPLFALYATFLYENVSVTTASVGQDLTFSINGPIDYTILPLSCIAIGGPYTRTLIVSGCTVDQYLVSNFVKTNTTHNVVYTVTFHAFKFYNVDDVTLLCNVKMCTSSSLDCDFTCNSGRRRKRVLDINTLDGSIIESISKRLIINDVVFGRSTRHNGPLGLILAGMIVFILGTLEY